MKYIKGLREILVALTFTTSMGGISLLKKDFNHKVDLFNLVKSVADKNSDDLVTEDEWDSVYESIGKDKYVVVPATKQKSSFKVYSSPWPDLSKKEMKGYLRKEGVRDYEKNMQ